jgi:drug/metabolite transporter (DMT)-like permease
MTKHEEAVKGHDLGGRSDNFKTTLLGFAAAGAVVMFWSGFNIVSRLGGRSALTPFDVAALRFGISALLLAPLLFRLRFAASLPRLLVLTAFGGLGYGLLVYSGFAFAPAAHAGVLVNGGIPFATMLVAWMATGYRPGARALLALAIAGVGIALIGYQSLVSGTPGSGPQWLGDLFFLAAATCFAIFGLFLKKWHVRPIEATVGVACIAAVLYLPVYLLFLPKAITEVTTATLVLQGFYQGVIAASAAAILYSYAVLTIGPMKASLMLALVPGISALAAVPALGEELGPTTLLGVLLVTAGAILGTTNPAKR